MLEAAFQNPWTSAIFIVLGALSIVMVAVALERWFGFREARKHGPGFAEKADGLWRDGDFAALEELCAAYPGTLARSIAFLVAHREEPSEKILAEAAERTERELRGQLQRIRPLSVIATISPLIGLFGTILGMIGAFETVALMGDLGDPSLLAGDISTALLTTAGGLFVAIPALALNHFFRSRITAEALILESTLTDLGRKWFPSPDQAE